MKNLVLILAFTAFAFLAKAQSTVLQSDENTEEVGTKVKVLVIPFHELRYYFSDCDKDIAKSSHLDIRDVRKSFMLGLDYATEHKMEDGKGPNYEPINLAQMKDSVDKASMAQFYNNVSYAYEAPSRLLSKENASVFKKMKKKFKQIGSKEKPKTLNEEESYTTLDTKDGKYMKLNWKNPAFLERLNAIYEPDMIVTINQFEIRTDYRKCIDRELNRYTREIKVHYNVFRPDGTQIYGDVVTAKYNSISDDINRIIQDNFGFLGEYIMESLPKK